MYYSAFLQFIVRYRSRILFGLLVGFLCLQAVVFVGQNILQRPASVSFSGCKEQSAAVEQKHTINEQQDALEVVWLKHTKTKPSFSMLMFAPNVDFVTKKIVKQGFAERDTASFIEFTSLQLLMESSSKNNKKKIAIDMGANMGFHSVHMALLGCHVLSFEPSPDTFDLLQANIRLNGLPLLQLHTEQDSSNTLWTNFTLAVSGGSVTPIQAGVSNDSGTGNLIRLPGSSGMTTFAASTSFHMTPLLLNDTNTNSTNVPNIQLIRTDQLLSNLGIIPQSSSSDFSLHLLKVDVEGYELFALQGLDLHKNKFKYLMVEFFPSLLQSCGVADPVELLLYIHQAGYIFLDEKTFQRRPFYDDQANTSTDTTSNTHENNHIRAWGDDMVAKAKKDGHFNLFAMTKSTIDDTRTT